LTIFDRFVKSPFGPIFVILAKAGIHPAEGGTAFAGVTAFPTFCETIKVINSGIVLKKALESILDGGIKVIGHSAVRKRTRGDDR